MKRLTTHHKSGTFISNKKNKDIITAPKKAQLKLWPLVMTMFFLVCGGAFGIEESIAASGPGMTLLLIILVPLLCALPTGLMVAELSTALPHVGGYYVWVKKALGPMWGFLVTWWTWISSWIDNAIYPILFAEYTCYLLTKILGFSSLEGNYAVRFILAMLAIWPITIMNIRGTKNAGKFSQLMAVFVFIPFIIISALGFYKIYQEGIIIWQPVIPEGKSFFSTLGIGLYIMMWNYSGWDGISTIGDEVYEPQKTYPKAIFSSILLVTLSYLIPVVACFAYNRNPSEWQAGFFSNIAFQAGGIGLALMMSVGALFSSLGQLNASIMSDSRVPFIFAHEGFLPESLKKIHPKYGTPVNSILCSAITCTLFSFSSFQNLIIAGVTLSMFALCIKFFALIALRISMPQLARPFKIPGGLPGVVFVTLLPITLMMIGGISMWQDTEFRQAIIVSFLAIVTGPICYLVLKKTFHTQESPSKAKTTTISIPNT